MDVTRLVWASNGQLLTGTLTDSGLAESHLIHDFNALAFERRTAPY